MVAAGTDSNPENSTGRMDVVTEWRFALLDHPKAFVQSTGYYGARGSGDKAGALFADGDGDSAASGAGFGVLYRSVSADVFSVIRSHGSQVGCSGIFLCIVWARWRISWSACRPAWW